VLHGDVRLLRRKLLSELLWNENIGEDKEEEVVALAVPARQEVEPLQDERKLPPLPPAVQMPVAATGENEEQVRRNEAVEAVERERVREREAERKKAQEEQERQARESERRQEEARRKSENERKASQELPVVNAKPPSADSADKSRAALTAGAYNMMPVPVMSGEIAAAIRERGYRRHTFIQLTDPDWVRCGCLLC
jgi:type IV secretory pathway VirB10-like protein